MLEKTEVQRALNKFRSDVTTKANTNFKGRGRVESELDVFPNSFSLSFLMEQYMEFQDKGVKGKKSSAKAPSSPYKFGSGNFKGKWTAFRLSINGWMVRKGIAPRNKSGQFLERKSIIYLIARSIYNTGLRPKYFFTKPFEQEFRELPDELIEAYGLDIERLMKTTLDAK
jgi:hypothetical protein